MIPYAVKIGDFTSEDLVTFNRVVQMFHALPEDVTHTCHSVARVLAYYAPQFRVVDGRFSGYEHSWIQREHIVIDTYPWASAEPFIVSLKPMSPWHTLYQETLLDPSKQRFAELTATSVLKQITAPSV